MQKEHIALGASLLFLVAIVVAIIGIWDHNTPMVRAANTLSSSSSEVITIPTTDGLPLNGYSSYIGSSSDGNIILFGSNATNLPNAGSSTSGIYILNVKLNYTQRVDVSSGGVAADESPYSATGVPIRISETGRYVIFLSKATNLEDYTTTPSSDYKVFKHDTQTRVTNRLSINTIPTSPADTNRNLAISNDGRFVLIASRHLASPYPNYFTMAYGDNSNGVYEWTALSRGNVILGGYASDNTRGSMSCDGAFVVHNKSNRIYLVDVRRGSNLSKDISGSGNSTAPIISCNGRYIVYATTNRTTIPITPEGMNTHLHLVRYDRITEEYIYIDSDSSDVFSDGIAWAGFGYEPAENPFKVSVSDAGDVVFKFGSTGNMYLKHLSDGSGTLEPIAMSTSGLYVDSGNGEITRGGNYIFLNMDPYNLGLASSPSSNRIIRIKTNI